jgi:hypothetical protein
MIPKPDPTPFSGAEFSEFAAPLDYDYMAVYRNAAAAVQEQRDEAICAAIAERIGEPVAVPRWRDRDAFAARFRDRIRRITRQGQDQIEWELDGKPLIHIWPVVFEREGNMLHAKQDILAFDKDGNPLA